MKTVLELERKNNIHLSCRKRLMQNKIQLNSRKLNNFNSETNNYHHELNIEVGVIDIIAQSPISIAILSISLVFRTIRT